MISLFVSLTFSWRRLRYRLWQNFDSLGLALPILTVHTRLRRKYSSLVKMEEQ